jgi:hypothetical protein
MDTVEIKRPRRRIAISGVIALVSAILLEAEMGGKVNERWQRLRSMPARSDWRLREIRKNDSQK